ncbi:MAG TPA: ABC transporter ATP-binding protein [Candidatus Methylomirabilis sp.]|nr:ABC transporter ATP-binding protein [Candidatus Methylomirabilis sp.]
MNPEPLLEVLDLEVAYGDVQVIWGISFSVTRGETVTLIGPNGAGKTTTLRTLSGLLRPRAGRIRFRGAELADLPAHEIVRRGVIQIPEGRKLWPRMSVEENLLLGAFAPTARRTAPGQLDHVYELFPRLKDRRRQLAGTLSGGEQQMCAIGRGLMSAPELLMFDEPSLGLAPLLVNELFARIAEIGRQGVTILLVEQKVAHTLEIADRGYILEGGRTVLTGTGQELLRNDYVQRSYLGVT